MNDLEIESSGAALLRTAATGCPVPSGLREEWFAGERALLRAAGRRGLTVTITVSAKDGSGVNAKRTLAQKLMGARH